MKKILCLIMTFMILATVGYADTAKKLISLKAIVGGDYVVEQTEQLVAGYSTWAQGGGHALSYSSGRIVKKVGGYTVSKNATLSKIIAQVVQGGPSRLVVYDASNNVLALSDELSAPGELNTIQSYIFSGANAINLTASQVIYVAYFSGSGGFGFKGSSSEGDGVQYDTAVYPTPTDPFVSDGTGASISFGVYGYAS